MATAIDGSRAAIHRLLLPATAQKQLVSTGDGMHRTFEHLRASR